MAKAHAACTAEGCDRLVGPKGGRGFCPKHYQRWHHSSSPPCSIVGCEKNQISAGLCSMHYQRLRARGTVGTPEPERISHQGATCSVEGCGQQRRKLEWCASHYSQRRRIGDTKPFSYKWAERIPCMVCGVPSMRGFRRFCSDACRVLWNNYDGEIPASFECRGCGKQFPFDLSLRPGSRRALVQTLQCGPCRRDFRKHGFSVVQLAERDGAWCSICRRPVRMYRRHPDPLAPSVDHFIPRALGGTNDPANCGWRT